MKIVNIEPKTVSWNEINAGQLGRYPESGCYYLKLNDGKGVSLTDKHYYVIDGQIMSQYNQQYELFDAELHVK